MGAIVTGGGTGIGKAIATELLHLGCKVVVASRNLERLTQAAESLEHIGEIKPMQCNIRKEADVKSTVTKILEDKNLGKIDFLINNGGGQFPSMTHNMTLKGKVIYRLERCDRNKLDRNIFDVQRS